MEDFERKYRRGEGYEQTTDMGLIYQAQGHHPQGWVVLAELYMPMVYRWSRRVGLQPADSSDVVQQVFWKLWNKIDQFSKTDPGDSFRAWLKTITKNEIADWWRKAASMPQSQSSFDAALELEAIGGDWDQDDGFSSRVLSALDAANAKVSPQTWEIFVRTVLYGEFPSEVARDIGIDANAVRQARYRVIRILQKELEPLSDA